jgi:hypothetical protein
MTRFFLHQIFHRSRVITLLTYTYFHEIYSNHIELILHSASLPTRIETNRGVRPSPFTKVYLSSHTKFWCTFQLRGQIHSPLFLLYPDMYSVVWSVCGTFTSHVIFEKIFVSSLLPTWLRYLCLNIHMLDTICLATDAIWGHLINCKFFSSTCCTKCPPATSIASSTRRVQTVYWQLS